MEKYTFRMEQGGQLKHRPDIGQPPPVAVTGEELASFFLSFLDGSLPLSVKSAPAPPLSPAQQNAHQKMLFQQHLQKQQEQQQQRRQLSHPWGSSKTASSGLDDGFNSEAVVLVGSTFRNAVLDETKDVAVLFFAPWCPACQLVEPVIDKAAERVREVLHSKRLESNTTVEGGATEEDVVLVAKMDLTQNDIALRGVSVRHYPSLWLWPRGAKEAPLDYSQYNHEREDAGKLESQHSHYELGMLVDFMTHFDDHRVRHVHTDGGVFDHLFDA